MVSEEHIKKGIEKSSIFQLIAWKYQLQAGVESFAKYNTEQ